MMPVRIGLIVTGTGEARFLPRFFRSIMQGADCIVEVVRKSEQIRPRTSAKPPRRLQVTGTTRPIPPKDIEQYGLPAANYIRRFPIAYVVVIDDLEGYHDPPAAFARYRAALDAVLGTCGLSARAAVHFFVPMLEAYYFSHSHAVNESAGRPVLEGDHPDDVESLPHPKNRLKALWFGFDEIEHGKKIVDRLDLHHVLSNPQHCCWLRALWGWCVEHLQESNAIHDPTLLTSFGLAAGQRSETTMGQ